MILDFSAEKVLEQYLAIKTPISPTPTKGAPLGGRRAAKKKKFFFRQKFLDSIGISYEKFRFDPMSITHQTADFPPPPSKAALPRGG